MDTGTESKQHVSDKELQSTAAAPDEKRRAPVNRPAMATIDNDDERLLARIGYKQVRKTGGIVC